MSEVETTGSGGVGFGASLELGSRPALLIVDFVGAYVVPGSPLYAGPEVATVRAAAQALLAVCRDAGLPIFHTNLAYERGGRDGGVFFRKVPGLRCFERGLHPELAAFASGLEPLSGETVVTKQYASAFFATPLASSLTALGVDTLLIGGVSTSGCIRATAVDCCQHGFIPAVVREAVGDRAGGTHDANLFDLQAKYAEVIRLEEARRYLQRLRGSGRGE